MSRAAHGRGRFRRPCLNPIRRVAVARQNSAQHGRISNASSRRPRSSLAGTSCGTMDGARGGNVTGLAMSRRARPRSGVKHGLVKGLEHATPLHLLHPRLRRIKPPIPGTCREADDQRHNRTPMALRLPRLGPSPSGLAPLHKMHIILRPACSFLPRRRRDGVKLHVLSTAGGIFWRLGDSGWSLYP